MKLKSSLLIALIALPCLCASLFAQALVLKPGETQTVNFDQLHFLEKGGSPQSLPRVAVRAAITLQADGKTLVVKLQHLAAQGNTAVLYGFDLGLSNREALQARVEARYSEFSENALWIGPTDDAELTAGKGAFTFASRDAVLGDIKEFLQTATTLPPSFLSAGQQGCITIRFLSEEVGGPKPLRLSPIAYFLTPDPSAPTSRRLRVAARLNNGNGQ